MNKRNKLLIALLSVFCASFVVFAASCGTKKFALTFDTQGIVSVAKVEVENGKEYKLADISKEGYEFEGWYLTSDFSGEAVTSVKVTANTTVYAKLTKLTLVTLDLAGGAGSGATGFYIKPGATVLDRIKITPTKPGHEFGGWFNGETEINKNFTAGEQDLVLTARYKVKYELEIWVKAASGDEYEKREENVVGYEYAQANFAPEYKEAGLIRVSNEGEVARKDLTESVKDNVYKLYFDRETFTLVYNAGGDASGETHTETLVYGVEKTAEPIFTAENKVVIGWSETPGGKIKYSTDFFGRKGLVENADAAESKADKIAIDKNTVLYAVWLNGATDMLGGLDTVYLPDEKGDVVYLCRGGKYFKGEYDTVEKVFYFRTYEDEQPKTLFYGKMVSGLQFVYSSSARATFALSRYELIEQNGKYVYVKNDNVKVTLDEFNGITYSVKDENGNIVESHGSYLIKDSYYHADFIDGELSGKNLVFIVSYITNKATGAITDYVFVERNEEQCNWGTLIRFGTFENTDGKVTLGTTSGTSGNLTLNGFTSATFDTGTQKVEYLYSLIGDTLTLKDPSSGNTAATLKIVEKEFGGKVVRGYVFYKDADAHEYIDGVKKLALDGGIDAIYFDGEKNYKGYYLATNGVFGSIVRFTSEDGTLNTTFVASTETVEEVVPGEDGTSTTEKKVNYNLAVKTLGYTELRYINENNTYYYPLLVLNDGEAGKASVYVYTKTKAYVKAADGTVVAGENGKYVFTATKSYDLPDNAFNDPIDFAQVASFAFSYYADDFTVHYWYSYNDKNGNTVDFSDKKATYSPAGNQKGSLYTFGGFLFYKLGSDELIGTYKTEDGITTVTLASGTLYFELNDTEKNFVKLDYAPYSAYRRTADGTTNKNIYLALDGKGGATWTELGEDGKTVTNTVKGTVSDTGRLSTISGEDVKIYEFKGETKNFKYILLTSNKTAYFAEYVGNGDDRYDAGANGFLQVDGFGFKAKYTDGDGTVFEECNYVVADGSFKVLVDETIRYFDITGADSVNLRGVEYGSYLFVVNNNVTGEVFELDGYGKLKVYKNVQKVDTENNVVKDENGKVVYEKKYIDENGTYSLNASGKAFTYSFKRGAETITGDGVTGTYTLGDNTYRSFVSLCEDVVCTYVITDNWSVIVLDNAGNATVYGENGSVEQGRYTIVTGELLYYYNNARTDSCIFKYNKTDATMTKVVYRENAFYTKDVESLLFSSHGFAIFNGTQTYYYSIEENGDVLIYRLAEGEEQANEYGFVCEKFGTTAEFAEGTKKTYGGKEYFYSDGWAISFDRAEATKDEYPFLVDSKNNVKKPLEKLIFTPSGAAEFTVSGKVTINGTEFNCYVVRSLKEKANDSAPDEYETYVKIGNFKWDISLNYKGQDVNEYSVSSLSYNATYMASAYMDLYYMMYVYFGASAAANTKNEFGTVTINQVFDAAGELTSNKISGAFGAYAGLTDIKGNPVLKADATDYAINRKGIYAFDVKVGDGFDYRMYINFEEHSAFGIIGYRIYAFTRVQKLTTDGYEVDVERVVYSDYSKNIPAGTLLTLSLKAVNGEEKTEIKFEQYYTLNGVFTGIVRTKDAEGKRYVSAVYYKFTFTENDDAYEKISEIDNETVIKGVASYASVTVTAENINTVYASDGYDRFVDINTVTNKIEIFYFNSNYYIATDCTYDEASATWKFKVGNYYYTAKLNDEGRAVITQLQNEV